MKAADNSNRFQWSQRLQGIILSSFYWGYILTEIPGGILVQKYGGKLILLITTFLSAVVVALTPFAVAYGKRCIFFRRFPCIFKHLIRSRRSLWPDCDTRFSWIFTRATTSVCIFIWNSMVSDRTTWQILFNDFYWSFGNRFCELTSH